MTLPERFACHVRGRSAEYPIAAEQLCMHLGVTPQRLREIRHEVEEQGLMIVGFAYGRQGHGNGYYEASDPESYREVYERLHRVGMAYLSRGAQVKQLAQAKFGGHLEWLL